MLIACPTCGRLQFDMDTVVADIEERLQAYEDPVEVAVLGCAVNGIGEASHADFGITGAKNEGLIFSRGKALKKVPQEQLVDALFAEIDKYAKTKKIEVDATEQQEGAAWLERIEEENAGELTPERLAKLEAEKAARRRRRHGRGAQAASRRVRLADRRPPLHPGVTAAELLAAYAARERSPVEVVAELVGGDRGRPARRVLGDLPGAGRGRGARRLGAWARGDARPLEGVPIAVKDLFDTEGVETTYGSAMFRGHVPSRDAEAVRLVREAGAIVLGKTATHEFAWGFSSINDRARHGPQPARPRARGGWIHRRLRRRAGGRAGAAGARAPTPAARSASRARSARSTASSRRAGGSASTASGRSRARSTTPGRWRARRATSRCCSACSRRCRSTSRRRRRASSSAPTCTARRWSRRSRPRTRSSACAWARARCASRRRS